MDIPEKHSPQFSKRAEAINNLSRYFKEYLKGLVVGVPDESEMVQRHADKLAIDAWKIVKKAEGFEP